MVTFSTWLNAAIKETGISLKPLSRKAKVDYSYLWRLVHEKKRRRARPRRKWVEQIGKALGMRAEALIAAGYPLETTRPGEDRTSVERCMATLDVFLSYFRERFAVDKGDADSVRQFFAQTVHWIDENRPWLDSWSDRFAVVLNRKLKELQRTTKFPPERAVDLSEAFMELRDSPRVRIPKSVLAEAVRKQPAWKTGPLRELVRAKILDPGEEDEVGLVLHGWPASLPILLLRRCLENRPLEELTPQEREILQLAKITSTKLWNVLAARINVLDPEGYYDEAKSLFTSESSPLYIFSTSPGLLLPLEYAGKNVNAFFSDFLRRHKKLSDQETKNTIRDCQLSGLDAKSRYPLRLSYFEHGFLHGCSNNTHVYYQFDLHPTAEMFQGHYRKLRTPASRALFVDFAVFILKRFLETENATICAGDFSGNAKKIPFGLDWRYILTITSPKWALLSARLRSLDQRVHGVMLSNAILENVLSGNIKKQMMEFTKNEKGLIPSLAAKLFQKGKIQDPINEALLSKKGKAQDRAEETIRRLLSIKSNVSV
ncbi:hypothetical protein MYX77_01085 [Acidobacteriia bacterium AH_259_A11_L15]|nr:hypothetical protein [Acidobacteriia bacterium AH_259_A11_L15]